MAAEQHSKFLLVEGLPGSGKSTVSRKIHASLTRNGVPARLYNEGDLNPADLSWHSCMPFRDYEVLLEKYPDEKSSILQQTIREDGCAITAYTKVKTENPKLFSDFARYEVYDGKVPFELFKRLHLKRWGNFAGKAAEKAEISIFECAYLQNHLCELIAYRNADDEFIISYMKNLIGTVKDLNPIILYLSQPDVREAVEWIGSVRVNESGEKDWLNRVVDYIENSPYGKLHNLHGVDGCIEFFERRRAVELRLLQTLGVTTFIIDNPGRDWHRVWEKVSKIINANYC